MSFDFLMPVRVSTDVVVVRVCGVLDPPLPEEDPEVPLLGEKGSAHQLVLSSLLPI